MRTTWKFNCQVVPFAVHLWLRIDYIYEEVYEDNTIFIDFYKIYDIMYLSDRSHIMCGRSLRVGA